MNSSRTPLPREDRSSAGRLLGPYELLAPLGQGAMSEVFMARHRYLGCIRAVKVLHPHVSAEPDTVGRLLMEARALALLRHPAIVEVHDCDVLGETAFIAMEYLAGESLRAWLDRTGRLSHVPRLAAAIVAAIAEGLAFAHRRGVVHRDLKPENILLVPDPADCRRFSVKILDFGLAKVKGEEPLTTTRTGCVMGTALYMAPERWHASQPVDHRSDIYALGCLFFELLCGRPPFCESTDADIMRAHLVDAPPELADLAPDLPPAFQPLLARMLAKAPEARHGSVDEVLAELEPILGRDRSTWRKHLRMPRPAGVPLALLDDDTQPDGRLELGRGAALVAWLRDRLSLATWLRARVGPLAQPRGRRRLSKWWRNRLAQLNRFRERIRLPAPLRDRFGRWFDDVSFRMAIGGSIAILGAALLLTGRGPAARRPAGSPEGARVAAPAADLEAVDTTAAPAPVARLAATGAAPGVAETPIVPVPARRQSAYSVLVTSDPPGAQAWLPGERTARGRTPLDIALTSRRPRRLRLVAPGFRTATLIISGARHGSRAHARLTPADTTLRPSAGRRRSRPAPNPIYQPARD